MHRIKQLVLLSYKTKIKGGENSVVFCRNYFAKIKKKEDDLMNIPLTEKARNNLFQELERQKKSLNNKLENLHQEVKKTEEKEKKLRYRREQIKIQISSLQTEIRKIDCSQQDISKISFSTNPIQSRKERLEKLYRDYPALRTLEEDKLPNRLKSEYDL